MVRVPIDAMAVPVMPTFDIPTRSLSETNPAAWTYERLAKQIAGFEDQLDPNEEIGLRLVGVPGADVMHVEDVGYWGPDLIIFHGTNEHGKAMQLIQHNSQISLLLTAVPVEKDKPRRIGFILMERVEDDGA